MCEYAAKRNLIVSLSHIFIVLFFSLFQFIALSVPSVPPASEYNLFINEFNSIGSSRFWGLLCSKLFQTFTNIKKRFYLIFHLF